MKTVDIISPGSINAIIGPVGTLKRILKNQSYFNVRGYDVTVFAPESLKMGPIKVPPIADYSESKIKTGFRHKIGSFLRMKAKTCRWVAEWYLNRSRKNVEQLVNYYISLDRKPDIIEFHSDWECYFYMLKRKESSAKIALFMHSDGIPFKMELQYYPVLEGTPYLTKLKKQLDYTVGLVDRMVFIAKVGQKNFLERYPNRSLKDTTVILNGIDDLSVIQADEVENIKAESIKSNFRYRLCCTGTINTRKGHRIIIDALRKLPKELLDQIHVDFIGDGGERPVLEELVSEYGLKERITFYGAVPNVDVYKYLAKNNIYILMSKNEGLPISIIEAMRAGLPIISTKVSGIPELVDDGYNGFLIEPDVDELIGVFYKLHEVDLVKMGDNSRLRFKNEFHFDRMMREFCDMYDSL